MKKRNGILVSFVVGISFSLAVALSYMLAFAFDNKSKTQALENGYERSFYTLLDSVNNLETDLSKLTVAIPNADSVEIIQSAHANAQTAITGYSGLPIDFNNEYKCLKFFNQVADWSASYIRCVAKGNGEDYKKHARSLYETARTINDNLKEIASKTEGKKLYTAVGDNLLPKGLENIDFTLSSPSIEYPTLIYDGPFSDREEEGAIVIANKKEISKEQARKIAQESLDMQNVEFVGESDGNMPSYDLEGEVNGRRAYCSITKKGGYVSNFTSSDGKIYEKAIDKEMAERISQNLLARLGYTNMQAVWYNQVNSDIYLNFAPVINSVIYYPDLVKVRISGSGQVEGLDASGYISSFKPRQCYSSISSDSAVAKISELDIKSVAMAIIPKGNSERFCYEIYGDKDGLDYYVYIDATTGEQVEILRVVDSAQGRKTI